MSILEGRLKILKWKCMSKIARVENADSSDFGLLGEQSPQNGRFLALDADEPPCKIWRR